MSLMRREPYDLFYEAERAMNRAFERMRSMMFEPFAPFSADPLLWPDAQSLAVDMSSDENNIIVRTALPGFTADEVHVDVRGNVLTISAESKAERDDRNGNWHIRELRYGKFARSVELPEAVDIDKADASLENGILTVKLPKEKPSPIRRIAVKARQLLQGNGKKS
ncbi:MAG: Hsp20/alpha crystallin family protein [Chloroflexota bacterium]|nr:MAG: hypothetical protein DIU68_06395 [Chloroflexota bacterium]